MSGPNDCKGTSSGSWRQRQYDKKERKKTQDGSSSHSTGSEFGD